MTTHCKPRERGIFWLLLRAGLHEERLFMLICGVEWSEATVRRERRPREPPARGTIRGAHAPGRPPAPTLFPQGAQRRAYARREGTR